MKVDSFSWYVHLQTIPGKDTAQTGPLFSIISCAYFCVQEGAAYVKDIPLSRTIFNVFHYCSLAYYLLDVLQRRIIQF